MKIVKFVLLKQDLKGKPKSKNSLNHNHLICNAYKLARHELVLSWLLLSHLETKV